MDQQVLHVSFVSATILELIAFFMSLSYRHIVTARYISTERCAGVPIENASLSFRYMSKTEMKRYRFGTLLKHSQWRFVCPESKLRETEKRGVRERVLPTYH